MSSSGTRRDGAGHPLIAVTPGEPGGIGPDLCLQLAARPALRPPGVRIVFIADPDLMRARARLLGLDGVRIVESDGTDGETDCTNTLAVLPVRCPVAIRAGTADPASAEYVLETLDQAIDGCLRGRFDALVTGPLNKAAINQAGIPFTGHTEYLADRTGTPRVVMMLAARSLRVALVTTHLPLRRVADAITRAAVEATLGILLRDLRQRFRISRPRILVCGLNPHAGESGELGHEDEAEIRPAIDAVAAQGHAVRGPWPADSAFLPDILASTDVVLAMYHDQGLPVLKHHGFGRAVNITLGLPMIRTSVDHGTALALAGRGGADAGSLSEAIALAAEMHAAEREAATRI